MSQSEITSNKAAKPRYYYGYVVVAAVFLMLLVLAGAGFSYGVFFKSIIAEFGWPRAVTTGPYTLNMILQGILFVATGRLSEKYGPRIILTCTGFLFGLGYVLMSQVHAMWQIYLFYGVIIAIGSSGFMLVMSLVTGWFTRERGLINGIALSGVGVGIMAMPLLANWLIVDYNWRLSFIVVGLLSAAVIIFAAQFLRHHRGQALPLARNAPVYPKEGNNLKGGGIAIKAALRTRQFWLASVAFLCFGAFMQAVMVHLVPHATDLNISATLSATFLTIIGGVGIGGRIIFGGIADRISKRIVLIISFAGTTLALVWLLVAGDIWMFDLFAVLFGFFQGGIVVMQAPVYAELFGLRLHATYMGLNGLVYAVGAAIFTVLSGYLFDVTGSYRLAFIILGILSFIGLLTSLLLTQLKEKPSPVRPQTEAPYPHA